MSSSIYSSIMCQASKYLSPEFLPYSEVAAELQVRKCEQQERSGMGFWLPWNHSWSPAYFSMQKPIPMSSSASHPLLSQSQSLQVHPSCELSVCTWLVHLLIKSKQVCESCSNSSHMVNTNALRRTEKAVFCIITMSSSTICWLLHFHSGQGLHY